MLVIKRSKRKAEFYLITMLGQQNMTPTYHNNIEYIQYPPPVKLIKAMEKVWAKQLIYKGKIRLTNVVEYRKSNPSNPDQADPYENIGIKICQGVECTTDTAHPTFIWCCAKESANTDELVSIDTKYNCILSVDNPQEFFEAIVSSLMSAKYTILAQAGFVYYDKGEEENKQFWGDNSFQKHSEYEYQKEYRLSINDLKATGDVPFIDLEIGDCSKLLSVIKI